MTPSLMHFYFDCDYGGCCDLMLSMLSSVRQTSCLTRTTWCSILLTFSDPFPLLILDPSGFVSVLPVVGFSVVLGGLQSSLVTILALM